MNRRFILRGHKAVICNDLLTWAKWIATANRRVARDKIGESEVSTVFRGVDHNFTGKGRPALFETMIFGGSLDGKMESYYTWEEAAKGHKTIVKKVRREYKS